MVHEARVSRRSTVPVRPRRDARVYAARPAWRAAAQEQVACALVASRCSSASRDMRSSPGTRSPPSSAASQRSEGPAELFGMTTPRRRRPIADARSPHRESSTGLEISRGRRQRAAPSDALGSPCPAERPRERGASGEPSRYIAERRGELIVIFRFPARRARGRSALRPALSSARHARRSACPLRHWRLLQC